MSRPELPRFRTLLKSREVEDPVNLWVHRPLAYAFVVAVFRTPITPNQVTLLATLVGAVAGGLFLWGTAGAMLAGGICLWASAILDGADGILARAKNMQSQFGRALDGWADMMVAVFTVFPAFWHLWAKDQEVQHLVLMVPAIGLTAVHLWGYDYFKESYLRMTRLDRGGEGDDPTRVAGMVEEARARGFMTYVAVKHVLLPYLQTQQKVIRLIDPHALREGRTFRRDERTAAIWRRHNQGPMRLWALVSLAPHSYLMAICAMADRLDAYLWIRVAAMNAIFAAAVVWQRRATARTYRELSAIGAVEEDASPSVERGVLATEA